MADLEDVIISSLEDAQLPVEDPSPDLPTDEVADDPTPEETPSEPLAEAPVEEVPPAAPVEGTPPAEAAKPKEEDFDTKYGITPTSPSGRENRIPYSRVKKIAQKAVRDAKKEWEAEHTPKFTEVETKVKDYETKLGRVAKFEEEMVGNPDKHLQRLSKFPAYAEFFQWLNKAAAALEGHPGAETQAEAPAPQDEMPQPDQQLADGSMVYSMDGLKALLAWQSGQVETRVTRQIQDKYKPLEDYHAETARANEVRVREEAAIQTVRTQISEAREWDMFTENEAEIVKVLQENPRLSLEGAYRKVVLPKFKAREADLQAKLSADKNKTRAEVLAELKKAPSSTSASTTTAKSSAQETPSGPRDLEDVIKESIKSLQ